MKKDKFTIKRVLFTACLVLLLNCNTIAQVWPKYYGQADRKEDITDIIQAYDGGYLILGNYRQYGNKWGWLIKTDVNGNVLWERIIEGKYDRASALEETADGGILICGLTDLFNQYYDPYLLKLNACGELEWCKSFWVPIQGSSFRDVKVDGNGDIIVLASQYGPIPQEYLHLFKFSPDGDVKWIKAYCREPDYPESSAPSGKSILVTSDQKYLITGNVYWEHPWGPPNLVYTRPMFIMVDSSGNEEWVMPYGLNDTIIGTASKSIELHNGYFIGTGSYWYSQNYLEPIVMAFDQLGNEISYQLIKTSDIDTTVEKGSFNIIINYDSLFAFMGLFGNLAITEYDDIIAITNDSLFTNDFKIKDVRKIPYSRDPMSLKRIDASKLLFGATNDSLSNWIIYLAKMNLNLEFVTLDTGTYTYDSLCPYPVASGFISLGDCYVVNGEEELPSPEDYYAARQRVVITPFPNPANEFINFNLENTTYHSNIKMECYDLLGKKVFEQHLPDASNLATIPISNWQPGMYILLVKSKGKVVGKCRFVKI